MGDVYSVPSARGSSPPHVRGKRAVSIRSDSLLLGFAGPAMGIEYIALNDPDAAARAC